MVGTEARRVRHHRGVEQLHVASGIAVVLQGEARFEQQEVRRGLRCERIFQRFQQFNLRVQVGGGGRQSRGRDAEW